MSMCQSQPSPLVLAHSLKHALCPEPAGGDSSPSVFPLAPTAPTHPATLATCVQKALAAAAAEAAHLLPPPNASPPAPGVFDDLLARLRQVAGRSALYSHRHLSHAVVLARGLAGEEWLGPREASLRPLWLELHTAATAASALLPTLPQTLGLHCLPQPAEAKLASLAESFRRISLRLRELQGLGPLDPLPLRLQCPGLRMDFAGGAGSHTVLSHCQGTLLQFFTPASAAVLRAVCKEFLAACDQQPWDGPPEGISRHALGLYQSLFPQARSLSVCDAELDGEDLDQLASFQGLQTLALHCNFCTLDPACLSVLTQLPCLRVLCLHGATFEGVASLDLVADIAPLLPPHLQELHVTGFDPGTGRLTDAHFEPLRNLRALSLVGTTLPPTVTDAMFLHLPNLTELKLCCSEGLTDAALSHLPRLRSLSCSATSLTEAALLPLRGRLTKLKMNCMPWSSEGVFPLLEGLVSLKAQECPNLTDEGFQHLATCAYLDVSRCPGLTGAGFEFLTACTRLKAESCSSLQRTALQHLGRVKDLSLAGVYFEPVEGEARSLPSGFEALKGGALQRLALTSEDNGDADEHTVWQAVRALGEGRSSVTLVLPQDYQFREECECMYCLYL